MVVRRRLNIAGQQMVFITTTVKNWTPIFSNEQIAEIVILQFHETMLFNRISIVAYALMPSHIHALLGLKEIKRLSKALQSFKSLSARKVRPLLPQEKMPAFWNGTSYQFWKPRFDDLIIWSDKQFQIKVNYIHQNPVKAGLVEQAVDYKFSSAGDWILGERGLIPVEKNWSWLEEKVS